MWLVSVLILNLEQRNLQVVTGSSLSQWSANSKYTARYWCGRCCIKIALGGRANSLISKRKLSFRRRAGLAPSFLRGCPISVAVAFRIPLALFTAVGIGIPPLLLLMDTFSVFSLYLIFFFIILRTLHFYWWIIIIIIITALFCCTGLWEPLTSYDESSASLSPQ